MAIRSGTRGRGATTPTVAPTAGETGWQATRLPVLASAGLFTRAALEYAAHRPGQALTIVQAGAVTPGGDLDLGILRTHQDVALTRIDDDNDITRSALAGHTGADPVVLAELRAVPLRPRSADIVHCSLLLDRISHAELVLGRLVDALRPGGLLLLRTADRDCAAGFLDRVLPGPLRALAWRSLRPGEAGPYPAIYEQVASARGIQLFSTRHGLVIAQRLTCSRLEGRRRRPVIRAARGTVALLSRGRLDADHDELRYVIRKPEDRFARVL